MRTTLVLLFFGLLWSCKTRTQRLKEDLDKTLQLEKYYLESSRDMLSTSAQLYKMGNVEEAQKANDHIILLNQQIDSLRRRVEELNQLIH